MLVTFHSKDSAPVTLFGQVAVQLLHMMGHSGKVPGALYAEDVAKHLASLQEKMQYWPEESIMAKTGHSPDSSVSLHHRALPLIALLSSAVAGCNNVSWDKG